MRVRMQNRSAWLVLLGTVGLAGCAHDIWADALADSAFQVTEHATRNAIGDNAGPLFTGEKRGEYRDRKEVERLGPRRFRRTYGRDPDLYRRPHSSSW